MERRRSTFKNAWIWAVEHHPEIHSHLIDRPRTLARFTLAMAFPTLFVGAGALHQTPLSDWPVIVLVTDLAVVIFCYKFLRFDREFRVRVLLCTQLHEP